MKFGHTIIYVKDVVKTVEFYEKAFGLVRQFIDPQGIYAQMETGEGAALGFACETLAKSNIKMDFNKNAREKTPAGFEISFTVSDVKKSLEKAVQAGCLKVTDPEHKPWGQEIAYVRDLNGVLIEFSTEM